jgi:Rod binding domain-containing protein
MSEALTGVGGVSASALGTGAPAARSDDATKQAEGFERLLLGRLTKELVDSALPESEESSPAVNAYRQMLPDALTEALMSGGGIGLAKQLSDATSRSSS